MAQAKNIVIDTPLPMPPDVGIPEPPLITRSVDIGKVLVSSVKPKPEVTPKTFIPVPSPPTLPRALTSDEKHRIRNLLDTNFDDAKGRYLSDYTDQKIGDEVNVPWVFVQQIRDLAYGPLKEDQRVTALRVELTQVREKLSQLNDESIVLGEILTSIEAKLTAIE